MIEYAIPHPGITTLFWAWQAFDMIQNEAAKMKERISITVEKGLLDWLDTKVSHNHYRSRSDGLEILLRNKIKEKGGGRVQMPSKGNLEKQPANNPGAEISVPGRQTNVMNHGHDNEVRKE